MRNPAFFEAGLLLSLLYKSAGLWYNIRKADIIQIGLIYHNGAVRLWYNSRKTDARGILYAHRHGGADAGAGPGRH